MNTASDTGGTQAIYDFWLGLIPQFFGRLGAGMPTGADNGAPGVCFPADQVAHAAAMTQEALQGVARAWTPVLEASGPAGLLAQWASAMPFAMPSSTPASKVAPASPLAAWTAMMPWLAGIPPTAGTPLPAADPLAIIGPWAAMMPFFAGAQGNAAGGPAAAHPMLAPWMAAMTWKPGLCMGAAEGAAPTNADGPAAAILPLRAMQKSWLDFASRVFGATPEILATGFDRTFGGVSDALGLGPLRKWQAAYQDLIAATVAQNDARMTYMMLVQSALVAGFDGLLRRLSAMADAGERIDSVLALLRMWAASTEEAVHRVLQSNAGLAATVALSRAGVTHRRKMQQIAAIVADALDMATRSDLDEAYREIQNLKRELRALRPTPDAAAPTRQRPRHRKRKSA
jgi:poly(hydroxyalkanoate) synthase III subunit E